MMYCPPKNDKTVMRAIELANSGHHYQASRVFQDAANQYRDPKEKAMLREAAKRHERIHYAD